MKTEQILKLLPAVAALTAFAVPVQAVTWGAWGNNTNLRSAQFQQAMQNLTAQWNSQFVNAGMNLSGAPSAGSGTNNALPVQLGNGTTLMNVTSGQMLNPATGLPTGAIAGAGGAGGGVAGGGSTAATITLPNDMIWSGFAGISAAEIATGRVTMDCPDPFFCSVKNPASTFLNNGGDVATQQAWGIWQGAPNATFAMYLKQVPNQATINFSSNNIDAVYAYAVGPWLTGTLPVTGTFNYAYLGGVIANSVTGAAGTVNSASLTVDFAAATVQNALNATIAGTTYAVNTPASPIAALASLTPNGSNGDGVTCTPACTASTMTIFNGASGAGAIVTTNIGTVMAQTVFKR